MSEGMADLRTVAWWIWLWLEEPRFGLLFVLLIPVVDRIAVAVGFKLRLWMRYRSDKGKLLRELDGMINPRKED